MEGQPVVEGHPAFQGQVIPRRSGFAASGGLGVGMTREPGSRWKDWVYWVAMIGGLLLGGLLGDVAVGAFLAGAGFFVQLATWTIISLACGLAAVFITSRRLRRLEVDP